MAPDLVLDNLLCAAKLPGANAQEERVQFAFESEQQGESFLSTAPKLMPLVGMWSLRAAFALQEIQDLSELAINCLLSH